MKTEQELIAAMEAVSDEAGKSGLSFSATLLADSGERVHVVSIGSPVQLLGGMEMLRTHIMGQVNRTRT